MTDLVVVHSVSKTPNSATYDVSVSHTNKKLLAFMHTITGQKGPRFKLPRAEWFMLSAYLNNMV